VLAIKFSALTIIMLGLACGGIFFLVWGSALTRRRLVITLLVSSILLPGITIPGLWQIRPEELITIALLPIVIMRIRWHWTRFDLLFGLIGLSVLVSWIWGGWQGLPLNARDSMEWIKLVKYWLFFHLALYPWSENDLRGFVLWTIGSVGIAAMIGILQWQNWAGLGALTRTLYGQGSLHVLRARVTGTMRNPNDFAYLLMTGFALTINVWALFRRKSLLLVVASLSMLAIISTTSRSGVLGACLVLGITVGVRTMWWKGIPARYWLARTSMVAILIGLLIVLSLPWAVHEYRSIETLSPHQRIAYTQRSPRHALVYRLSQTISRQAGIYQRVDNWQDDWSALLESPWIGLGPGKAKYSATVDSEYLLYLRRYGVLGLAILLFLYWQILRYCVKLLRFYPYDSVQWIIGLSTMAITASYLLVNLVATTFYLLQLMSFFWLLVGLGCSAWRFRPQSMLAASPAGRE